MDHGRRLVCHLAVRVVKEDCRTVFQDVSLPKTKLEKSKSQASKLIGTFELLFIPQMFPSCFFQQRTKLLGSIEKSCSQIILSLKYSYP